MHRHPRFRTFHLFLWGLFGLLSLGGVRLAEAKPISVGMDLSHPLLLHKKTQRIYLKISLTGGLLAEQRRRAPVNLSVVLDRSTSMQGDRLEKAKSATKMLLELLQPDDIFSLITYDSTVEVLVPATKLSASTKNDITQKIDKIYARGMTALFGGVSKGIAEVRKFLSKERVNRVILLSDGQANIGPSSPNALGRLGIASARQGISISTIGLGLGYNEDLMTQLAVKSDGNHGFARDGSALQRIFQAELGNVLSVIAQKIDLRITLAKGIRPIRILDSELQMRGNTLTFRWNQLYSKQHKYIIIEVEVPANLLENTVMIASTKINFTDMQNHQRQQLTQNIAAQRTDQLLLAQKHIHRPLMIHIAEALGNETVRNAMRLRDAGRVQEAQSMLNKNAYYLNSMGKKLRSPKLKKFGAMNLSNARTLKGYRWNETRKKIRLDLYKRRYQQTW